MKKMIFFIIVFLILYYSKYLKNVLYISYIIFVFEHNNKYIIMSEKTRIEWDLSVYKTKKLIFDKVPIEPKELTEYKSIIINKTKQLFLNKTQRNGFIIEIFDEGFHFEEPIASFNSFDGLMYSNVSFMATVLSIEPGNVLYDCEITIINDAGIFATKENGSIQISVFSDLLEKKNFIGLFSVGNLIDVEVIAVRDFVYDTRISVVGTIHFPPIVCTELKTALTTPTINKKEIDFKPATKTVKYTKIITKVPQLTGGVKINNSLTNKILGIDSEPINKNELKDNKELKNKKELKDKKELKGGEKDSERESEHNLERDSGSGSDQENNNSDGYDSDDDQLDSDSDSEPENKMDGGKAKKEITKLDVDNITQLGQLPFVLGTNLDLPLIELYHLINQVIPKTINFADLGSSPFGKKGTFPIGKETILIDIISNYSMNKHSQIIECLSELTKSETTYAIIKYSDSFEDLVSLQFICLLRKVYDITLIIPFITINGDIVGQYLILKRIGKFSAEWVKFINSLNKNLNGKTKEKKSINMFTENIIAGIDASSDKRIDDNFIRDIRVFQVSLNKIITNLQVNIKVIESRPKMTTGAKKAIQDKQIKIAKEWIEKNK